MNVRTAKTCSHTKTASFYETYLPLDVLQRKHAFVPRKYHHIDSSVQIDLFKS